MAVCRQLLLKIGVVFIRVAGTTSIVFVIAMRVLNGIASITMVWAGGKGGRTTWCVSVAARYIYPSYSTGMDFYIVEMKTSMVEGRLMKDTWGGIRLHCLYSTYYTTVLVWALLFMVEVQKKLEGRMVNTVIRWFHRNTSLPETHAIIWLDMCLLDHIQPVQIGNLLHCLNRATELCIVTDIIIYWCVCYS